MSRPKNPVLSLEVLKKAVAIREQMERLDSELRSLIGGKTVKSVAPNTNTTVTGAPRKRRQMSAAARAKISAAAKKRWAKFHAQKK
jgi:hypothetical protein